jgi:hypothetical protein
MRTRARDGKGGNVNEPITRREALKKGALFGGAALVWVRPSVNSYGMSSTLAAAVSGTEGCTPGFWKNNPTRALEVSGINIETAAVSDYYTVDEPFASTFLIDALGFQGGSGVEGATEILLRAAVAGLINAAALPGYGDFPLGQVQSALDSDDRDTMLALASQIDLENNQGCPFPADEKDEKKNGPQGSSLRPSEQVGGDA